MALKSLSKLCCVPEVHESLRQFLFDQRGDESFMTIFNELILRRNLKVESMLLLKAMTDLRDGRDFIDDQMKVELYLNAFAGSKKIVAETVALMQALGDDFWMEIIKLVNFYVTDNVNWDQFFKIISSVDSVSCNDETFIKIILENLDKPETTQQAAAILVEFIKFKPDEIHSMLEELVTVLLVLVNHEKTFVTMIELFNVIDFKVFGEFYKEETEKLLSLIDCFIQAFDVFESQVSLHNIVIVLTKISKLMPEYVTKRVRTMYEKLYDDLLKVNIQTEELCELYKKPLRKLTTLLENRNWNIVPMSSLQTILQLVENLCEDDHGELHSLVIRFCTNVWKQLWVRLVLLKPIPLSNEFIESNIEAFFMSLTSVIEEKVPEVNVEQASNYLCSLMDLAVMFPPSMPVKHSHAVFTKLKFPLKKSDVQMIANLVEQTVFKGDDSAYANSREMILLTWIAFCQNYDDLPSLTASEKIVRYYRPKCPFKHHIEILMNLLLNETTRHIFEQIVAFAILNLSNLDDLTAFKSFWQAIDEYLTKKFKDENKKLSLKSSICAQLLSKLKTHVELMRDFANKDRLLVLDYAAIIIRNMQPSFKQKLVNFIPTDLSNVGLNNMEQEHLDSFKTLLSK